MRVGGCLAVVAQWQSTDGSSQSVLGLTSSDCRPFTFLYFRLITSKFLQLSSKVTLLVVQHTQSCTCIATHMCMYKRAHIHTTGSIMRTYMQVFTMRCIFNIIGQCCRSKWICGRLQVAQSVYVQTQRQIRSVSSFCKRRGEEIFLATCGITI